MSNSETAKCATCGKVHPRSEIELAFHRPDPVFAITGAERSERVKETDDLCAIDRERYFVRSILVLPVHTREKHYQLGLWVELPYESFDRIYALWSEPNQSNEPAFSAVLANDIPTLASTCGLAVKLHLTGPTTRPEIVVVDESHQLFLEQTQGITEHRAIEYSSFTRGSLV